MHNGTESSTTVIAASRPELHVLPEPTIHRLSTWGSVGGALEAMHVLGAQGWPRAVGASTAPAARCSVFCLGPAEWWIVGNLPPVPEIESLVLVEITGAVAVARLRGPGAEDVLSCYCGLNLSRSVFPVASCARTRLGAIAVTIHRLSEVEFDCYAARSHMGYLLAALRAAGAH